MKLLNGIAFLIFTSSFLRADYNSSSVAMSLNIYLEDYNQLMAQVGVLVGFILLFFSIYLVILIAKK